MVPIKYNLSSVKGLAFAKLVTFTSDRITDMQSCVDFLSKPSPTVEAMTALREAYQATEASYKAANSEQNRQARDAAYTALIDGHVAWVGYAEPIIGDNADQAARFGYPQFAVRSSAEVPVGVPPKPGVELTPNPGEIVLLAKAYKQGSKAIYYNWQVSEDGGETFSYLPVHGNSHRRKTRVLVDKAYQFRVAYATTAGEGPFSDWVSVAVTRDMLGKERAVKKKAA